MKKAKLIKKINTKTGMGAIPDQCIYRLSEPLDGYEYVLVSAANTFDHGPETYIFGCDKKGDVLDFSELTGSFVGSKNHEMALDNAGYEVEN